MKQAIYKNMGVIFLIPKKCLTEEVYDKAWALHVHHSFLRFPNHPTSKSQHPLSDRKEGQDEDLISATEPKQSKLTHHAAPTL